MSESTGLKPCRVRRYAVVEVTSEMIDADDKELALMGMDASVDYALLLNNKIGRKIVDEVIFLHLDGATVESIDLDGGEAIEVERLEENQIRALKNKYAPGRRVKPGASSPKLPDGTGGKKS